MGADGATSATSCSVAFAGACRPSLAGKLLRRAGICRRTMVAAFTRSKASTAAPAPRKDEEIGAAVDESQFRLRLAVRGLRLARRLVSSARTLLGDDVLAIPRVANVIKADDDGPSSPLTLLLRYARSVEGNRDGLPLGNLTCEDDGDASREATLARVKRSIRSAWDGRRSKAVQKVPEESARDLLELTVDDVVEHIVQLDYRHWGHESVLKRLLPSEHLAPSSFEIVGHVVHLNLREEQRPHRHLIGRVLLDKIANVRAVVNKTDATGGVFRTFSMELLGGGEADLVTSLRENGCVFELDYGKVYWNSRLESEHRRLIDSFGQSDVVADAFAGVGPFAVPAARRHRCRVYANDLNPVSVEYLNANVRLNKVERLVTTSCEDGGEFLRRLISERVPFTRVVMNFPSGAPEVLDQLRGAYAERRELPLPKVHCYCFAPAEDAHANAVRRVAKALFGREDGWGADEAAEVRSETHEVRMVSPKKVHMCVSFALPPSVAYATERPQEAESKRQRLDDNAEFGARGAG